MSIYRLPNAKRQEKIQLRDLKRKQIKAQNQRSAIDENSFHNVGELKSHSGRLLEFVVHFVDIFVQKRNVKQSMRKVKQKVNQQLSKKNKKEKEK
jgi:hypothetical protein